MTEVTKPGHEYRRLERKQQVRKQATSASRAASRAKDLAWQERVRELGFASVGAYLRDRYLDQGHTLLQISREWRVGQATVYARLAKNGIPRQPPEARAAATKRRRRLHELRATTPPGEARTCDVWFEEMLRDGASQVELVRLFGRSPFWVRHSLVRLGLLPS